MKIKAVFPLSKSKWLTEKTILVSREESTLLLRENATSLLLQKNSLKQNRKIQKEQYHAKSTSSWGANTDQGQITTVRIKKQDPHKWGQKCSTWKADINSPAGTFTRL